MDWLDNILGSPTMQSLLGSASAPLGGNNPSPTMSGVSGYNNAAMGALPTQLGGAPAPTPNPMTPSEPNPITGGMMPIPNPEGANNVPGMGTNPTGTAGIAPNLTSPLGAIIDPGTGKPLNRDPLVSGNSNPLPMGPTPLAGQPGAGTPIPGGSIPGQGGPNVLTGGPQQGPPIPPGGPGSVPMPPGGAGIVNGGPGSTQVPMPPPQRPPIPGPTGPTPPPPTSPMGRGGPFMNNVVGQPTKQPGPFENFMGALGPGLATVQGNSGLGAFARGMGASMTAGSKQAEQQRTQAFEQSSKAFQDWMNALKTDNQNKVSQARAKWYEERTKQLRLNQGGKPMNPYQAAINVNNTVEKQRQVDLQFLKLRESNARYSGKPMTPEALKAEQDKIKVDADNYRNELLQRYHLTPQQAEQEVGRGTPHPYAQGDAAVPGRMYLNKDNSITSQPTPNTTSSVLPFHPQTMQDMHDVLPGQYYVNPMNNKLMRVPENAGPPSQRSSQAKQNQLDREDANDEYQNQDLEAA